MNVCECLTECTRLEDISVYGKQPTEESRYSRLFLGHRHTQFGMNQTFHYDLSSGVASLILQYFNFWHRSKYLSAESLFAVKYSPLRIHRIQRPETA